MSKLPAGERKGDDRIRFVNRQGKRILLVDLSQCTAREAEENVRRVPDVVTAEPRGSVLILTDFKGSSFDSAALRAIKEQRCLISHSSKNQHWLAPSACRASSTTRSKNFPAVTLRSLALARKPCTGWCRVRLA